MQTVSFNFLLKTHVQGSTQNMLGTLKKYPGDAILIETVIENYSSQDIVLKGFEVNGVSKGLIVTQPTSAVITPDSDKLLANKGVCTAQFLVKWDPAML